MSSPKPSNSEETAPKAPKLAALSKYSQYHLDAATPAIRPGLESASTDGLRGSDTSSESGLHIVPPVTSQQRSPFDDAATARDVQRSHQQATAESAREPDSGQENSSQVTSYILSELLPSLSTLTEFQNVSSPKRLSKFTPFGELPTELQDQICKS